MKHTLLLTIALLSLTAWADLDPSQDDALKKTQTLLVSPDARAAAIKQDPKAKDTDERVEMLMGSGAGKEDVYAIAAELLGNLAKEADGDPTKMMKIVEQAQKNPEAFYNSHFTATQKAKVKSLAEKVGAQKTPVNSK